MRINRTSIRCIFMAFAFCALSNGCIVIPVNFHSAGSRHNVNEDVMNALQPGTTTKEDVFVGFGEPDIVSANGNCLTYTWDKIKLIWILAGNTGATGGTVDSIYELVLCFDDQGLLNRKELKKKTKFD